jgi:hypothetical protein
MLSSTVLTLQTSILRLVVYGGIYYDVRPAPVPSVRCSQRPKVELSSNYGRHLPFLTRDRMTANRPIR